MTRTNLKMIESSSEAKGLDAGGSLEKIRNSFPPAKPSETGKMIAMLFSGLRMARQQELDATMTLQTYHLCLKGKPAFAIREAVEAFLTGDVKGASKTFVPATAELVREVNQKLWTRVNLLWRKKRIEHEKMAAIEPSGEVDPQVRARVSAGLRELSASLRAKSGALTTGQGKACRDEKPERRKSASHGPMSFSQSLMETPLMKKAVRDIDPVHQPTEPS